MARKKKADEPVMVYDYGLKSVRIYEGMSLEEFQTVIQEFLDTKLPNGTTGARIGFGEGYDDDFNGFYVSGYRPETEDEKAKRLARLRKDEEAKKKAIERNKDREYKVFLRLKKKFEG